MEIRTLCGTGALAAGLLLGLAQSVDAHFQVMRPSTDHIDETTGSTLVVDLVFTHPMQQGPAMPMEKPARVGVMASGRMEDLSGLLAGKTVDGKQAWEVRYPVTSPGDHVFFVEPKPYWEPAEGKMIVHYAKVVVDAFGRGGGWDAMIGLPVEIRPLVRPYGLWTGNLFRGIVERDGRPVPFAEIEVEWLNDGTVTAPSDAFVTQVLRADASGTFAYAMPRAGWWGFAALLEAEKPMRSPSGADVPVEQGALFWVRTVDMSTAATRTAAPR